MKNKKLAVCLIIFAFLVIVVILSSTIFALNNISLQFFSTTDKLTNSETDIISSANFKKGDNVLFLRKKAYIEKLEKAYPYLKVLNIETIFPNSIKINCVERTELFAIKLKNNSFAIVDEDMKVLKIQEIFINSSDNAIILTNIEHSLENVSEGDFLSLTEQQLLLINQTTKSLKEWENSFSLLKAKVKSVNLDYERENQVMIEMRSGVSIIVKDAHRFNSEKFNLVFSAYESDTKYQNGGILEVREVIKENKIIPTIFYLTNE